MEAPAGSLEATPLSFSSYSLTPAFVWALEVGARPKRPAAMNSVVDTTMICKPAPKRLSWAPHCIDRVSALVSRVGMRDERRRGAVAHQVRRAAEEAVCPRLHLSSAGDHPGAGDLSIDRGSASS